MGNTFSRCLGCVGRSAEGTLRVKEHQVSAKLNQNTRKLKRKDVYIKQESTTSVSINLISYAVKYSDFTLLCVTGHGF